MITNTLVPYSCYISRPQHDIGTYSGPYSKLPACCTPKPPELQPGLGGVLWVVASAFGDRGLDDVAFSACLQLLVMEAELRLSLRVQSTQIHDVQGFYVGVSKNWVPSWESA